MKLVTQTEALADRFGNEEAVRILCESGYDGIDFSMFAMLHDDDNVLNSSGFVSHVRKVKKIADFYGVTFEQAHSPFPSARENDDEFNRKMMPKLKRSLEIAGILDAKICVVHPVAFGEKCFERNLEIYHELEPYAAEYGVKIALENMWGWSDEIQRIVPNVCSTAEDFNRYIDALNPKNFTACLDLGHCGLVGEDAATMIKQMGHDRLGALHIHDNDFVRDLHTIPYNSKMDWDSIARALAEIDYKGNFTYEADNFIKPFPDELLFECERFMAHIGRSMIRKIEKYREKA